MSKRTKLEEKISFFNVKPVIPIVIIVFISLLIRLYFTPWGNISEASDTFVYLVRSLNYVNGDFRETVYNPLWPFLLAFFFSIIRFEDIIEYLDIMRIISLVISLSTIPVIYLIARNYMERKFALLATIFFAFEPNLIQNSIWAITEPIFILFSMLGFLFLIQKNSRYFLLSFVFAGLAFETRFSGIVLVLLSVIASIFKFDKKITGLKITGLGFAILLVISLPYSLGIIDRGENPVTYQLSGVERNLKQINPQLINPGGGILGIQTNYELENIQKNYDPSWVLKNVIIKELIHVVRILIPYLFVFVPIGIFFIFKQLNYKKIILILGISIVLIVGIPQYTYSAVFRNLFLLIPFFCIISGIGIEQITKRIESKRIVLTGLTVAVIITSILFLVEQSPDYELLNEKSEFGKYVANQYEGNFMGNDLSFISLHITQLNKSKIDSWSNEKITLKPSQFAIITKSDLENFIINYNVTHIVVSEKLDNRYLVFQDLIKNEEDFEYLDKLSDSNELNFSKYKVEIFKVDKTKINPTQK